MKSLKRRAAEWLARRRAAHVGRRAAVSQRDLLTAHLRRAASTRFGKEHDFQAVLRDRDPVAAYRKAVPVRDYEALRPYFERAADGARDELWPGKPLYLAKTSGTTGGAKYLPLTRESVPHHVRGARDALLFYIARTGNSAFLDGKMMFLSGSPALEVNRAGIRVGRLSGIAQHFVPRYLQSNRLPSFAVNCIEDWEEKISAVVQETVGEDLRLISGIPPWVQMFFERLRETTGKSPIEQWPRLSVFIHGGVDFTPYKQTFERSLGGRVDVVEVYPASEGFIAVQDAAPQDGLLLGLDYGIYFEFIPLEEYGKPDARRLGLEQVETNVQYALVLTTDAGLWAYDLGDTVRFTSLNPPRIKVTGRVKHFISAFGEHVIAEEVNAAMSAAVEECGGEVAEFTVAPLVSPTESRHEWWVEFVRKPDDPQRFAAALDAALVRLNPYYKDLRQGNILLPARLVPLKPGACNHYMKSIGKLGGQNKFPRLTNDRKLVEALLPFVEGPHLVESSN
ncbi:MAG: GH3 auxin-responsive promoter family protein [Bacteroidia bacterium]|nr:GH3 auxin-responsive promoter family protein [Bacteroidia bacterium]MDW8332742.1 GH3 auxin-responsive promoter family protein [Bacteroidia bacterium]